MCSSFAIFGAQNLHLMKLTTRLLLTLFLCWATCQVALAQPYNTAVGLRLGYPYALSLKHYLNNEGAVEAYLGLRPYSGYRSTNLSVAYQHHFDLGLDAELAPLRWYVGAGGTAYFWNYPNSFYVGRGPDRFSRFTIGVNGYLGLEYTFTAIPLNLTFDWVPTVLVGNTVRGSFGSLYGGLAARYTLGR